MKKYKKHRLLVVTVLMQAICALFVMSMFIIDIFGLKKVPLSWQVREYLEIAANVGLFTGIILGGILVAQSMRRNNRVEEASHAYVTKAILLVLNARMAG